MDINKIRVEINIPGEGDEAHEYEHCPIYFAVDRVHNICPLRPISCVFGLTTVSPPDLCPLRSSGVKMKFKIVK